MREKEDVVEMKEDQENVQSDSESEEDEEMYLYGNNQENSKRQRLVSSSSRDFSDVDLTTSSQGRACVRCGNRVVR